MSIVGDLRVPIVSAPMAGGPSTQELVRAVSGAGGLGMLAGALITPDSMAAQVESLRGYTFGVNLFLPDEPFGADVQSYAAALAPWFERFGVDAGSVVRRDDHYAAKLDWLLEHPVSFVSSTFGTFTVSEVAALHAAGSEVWATVTSAAEAKTATDNGVDLLIVQGPEAGGHRGSFDGSAPEEPLEVLLRVVAAVSDLPRIAAGGIMDGADIGTLIAQNDASAVQLGTAFLLTPEAGTKQAHREQLRVSSGTAVTKAFSGRPARGLVNRFLAEFTDAAPLAYPDVHYLTAPLRAAAAAANDPSAMNMWAGTGYLRAEARPAAELMAKWKDQLKKI